MVDTLHGEVCVRHDLTRAWCNLKPVIQDWFALCSSLEGVLRKSAEHVNHTWPSFRHFPDPKLVYAFTLARLGKLSDGASALEELVKSDGETYASNELRNALQRIAKV